MEFTRQQLQRNDGVDNCCHRLLCDLAGKDLQWDMEHIGRVAEVAEDIICRKLKLMSLMEFRPYIEE